MERLSDSKQGSHCWETISQILDHDLKKKSSPGVNLCECSVCGPAFVPCSSGKPSSAQAHAGQDVRDCKCKRCEIAFCNYSFQVNGRSHCEDKPNGCQEREEDFLSFPSLGDFVITRTEGGPHKCNVCGKVCTIPARLESMKESTQERSPISVNSVGKPSVAGAQFGDIKGPTLVRNPTTVRSVGRPSALSQALKDT